VTCACDAAVRSPLMQVLGPGGAVAYTGPPGGMTPELETLAGFTVEDGGEGDGAAGTTSPASGSGATTGSSQVATAIVSPSAGDAQVPKDADELVSSLCVVHGRCTVTWVHVALCQQSTTICLRAYGHTAPPMCRHAMRRWLWRSGNRAPFAPEWLRTTCLRSACTSLSWFSCPWLRCSSPEMAATGGCPSGAQTCKAPVRVLGRHGYVTKHGTEGG
jgi:hypothetical protein